MKLFSQYIQNLLEKSRLMGKAMLLGVLIFGIQTTAMAQGEPAAAQSISPDLMLKVVLAAVIVVSVLVLTVSAYIVYILRILLLNKQETQEQTEAELEAEQPKRSIIDRLHGAVAVEEEDSILLSHNYDGIRELDNHLPPWWKYLFYATIVFAGVYVGIYHVFDVAPLQAEEYNQEVAQAKAVLEARMASAANLIDESNVELTTEASELQNGEKIYLRSCAACHGKEGQGAVGPNLTDEYWLHGGAVKDVFKTIKYGVPGKGMVAWEGKLSPASMRDVASYLISLEGSNPPNPKAPQGEKYVRN